MAGCPGFQPSLGRRYVGVRWVCDAAEAPDKGTATPARTQVTKDTVDLLNDIEFLPSRSKAPSVSLTHPGRVRFVSESCPHVCHVTLMGSLRP